MAKLSGLQRSVLTLYRQCLRATRQKPAETRANFKAFTREEFRKGAGVDKRDFSAIEFMIRVGQRKLETYSAKGIRDIHR